MKSSGQLQYAARRYIANAACTDHPKLRAENNSLPDNHFGQPSMTAITLDERQGH